MDNTYRILALTEWKPMLHLACICPFEDAALGHLIYLLDKLSNTHARMP